MGAPELHAEDGAAPTGWRDRLLAVRDRLLTNPAFHRWAAHAPFARSIARRRARELFDLCSGFIYSQVLAACVRLRLLEALADGPRSAAYLGDAMNLSPDATERLLRAAVSLRLIEQRRGDRYGLGILGGAALANPGVLAMVAHHAILYDDLRDPVALLRGEMPATRLSDYWAYARSREPAALAVDAVSHYSALMAASQPLVADEILDSYKFANHRRLVDLGGGEGVFLSAVAARAPRLDLTLMDLPAVLERARGRLAKAGLAQRIKLHPGSFFADPLPNGADLVSLVRVLHDHDDAAVLHLLKRVREAIDPGGTLVVAEPMVDGGASVAVGEAYFAFYLLAMGSGRARTAAEIGALLRAAGFDAIRLVAARQPMHVRVITARPSAGSGTR